MTSPITHAIYLHGFASAPGGTKASRFAREFAELGVGFSCPDFNQPEFESLTITRMLEQVGESIRAAGPGPIALVGSSLGAFVALHAAPRWPAEVDRLVLLAPAVDFGGNRLRQFGDRRIEDWRRRGRLPVFHFGYDEIREIGYALYEDAGQYDAFALGDPPPTLIVHGRRDESVDPAMVERWADTRANVDLHLIDDDHQLTSSIDVIFTLTKPFLGLAVG